MTSYVIATINISDREQYANYEAGFMEIFDAYNGKILSVDEAPHTLEGDWSHTRTVLIEFPGKQDVLAWYNSEAYQALAAHRWAASSANIAIIESPAGPLEV